MPIDWVKVAESGMLIVPTAVASGYAGARIKAYLDRAKPVLSIENCRVGQGRDFLGLRVDIGKDLALSLRESPWTPSLSGSISAFKLEAELEELRRSIKAARETLGFLDRKIEELPTLQDSEAAKKRQFLDEITRKEVAIIDAAYTGSLVRGEIKLKLPADEQLQRMPIIAEYVESDESEGGYLIHLGTKRYVLRYKHKRDNAFLLPAAKAFSLFHIPSLRELLEHSRNDITAWAAQGDDLVRELEAVLDQGRHLVVEVSIVNRGRSPALFSQWGLLQLVGSGSDPIPEIELKRIVPIVRPDDPLIALAQEEAFKDIDRPLAVDEKGFVIEGASSAKLLYRSIGTTQDLERRIPNLRAILSMEVFLCQLAVRRADVSQVRRSWVVSARSRFSKQGQPFPSGEIREVIRRWA